MTEQEQPLTPDLLEDEYHLNTPTNKIVESGCYKFYDYINHIVAYLPVNTLVSWEHSNVHDFKYDAIEPVSISLTLNQSWDGIGWNFHDGNHRVNFCNQNGLPLPVVITDEEDIRIAIKKGLLDGIVYKMYRSN